MPSSHQNVLIVDDDSSHLEIYGLLVKQAGYVPLPALVKFLGADLPKSEPVDLVLLDYKLNSVKTSVDLAREIRASYPLAPILLLSDLWTLPADIAPFVADFVRKGDPAKLLEALSRLLAS